MMVDKYRKVDKNSLGCGLEVKDKSNRSDFLYICGVANAWGEERLCFDCDKRLKDKWAEDDLKVKDEMKGGINNNDN